ncbi:MAG: DNA-binding response regulator [Paenibacillus sp.]|jgi:two-component system response regulator YesN|nr:DNA-binding response regulator [Paenibacillus sp.]
MRSIVIIDDDPNLLEGMRYSIPWDDLQVEWIGEAIDGRQGLKIVRERQPDIVMTDINMPVMNGLEMIEALRDEGFKGKFIILSGYADFEYARQAVRLQVDDYLSKPISVDSLHKVVSRVSERLDYDELTELEYVSMKDQLKLYQPFVMHEWLKSIVTGSGYEKVNHIQEIKLKTEQWSMQEHLILGLEVFVNEPWKALENERSLLRFVVQNVTCEIVGNVFTDFDYVELHSYRYAIILHAPSEETSQDWLILQAEPLKKQLFSYLTKQLKISLRIELGSVIGDWRMLADSVASLFQADETENLSYAAPIRSFKFFRELATAIRNANETEAKHIIAGYESEHLQHQIFDGLGLNLWAGELWATIAYSLYDIGIELEQITPKFNPTADIHDEYTPSALRVWLEQTIALIINSHHWSDNIKHRQMTDFIVRFVHEHYADNLTLGVLADEIQISKNYLGQIFRNVIGETFNQYVTRVRMEKAKQMILEGKYYIYEIADKVGYSNIPYFSSQFKKYNGVNPTDLTKNKE